MTSSPSRRARSCSSTPQADKFVNLLDYGGKELKEQLPALEVAAGHTAGRQAARRSRHRRRPAGHVLPQGPVREGRLPDRPRRGRQALADVGRLHRQAARSSRRRASSTKCARTAPTNIYNAIVMQNAGNGPATPTSTRSNNLVIDSNPAVKQAWDKTLKMIEDGLSANLTIFTPSGTRLQERHVRHHRLPGLDDRRTSRDRPVRPARASGTSRPSPAAAATGAARSSPCRSRASTRRRPSSWPSS